MIDIFIPSYKRADNCKTLKYFVKIGWMVQNLHVVIDDQAEDYDEYKKLTDKVGANLHVLSLEESRRRFDYVHRPSESRRSAGQMRNLFYDVAERLGIEFFVMQDDDTNGYEIKRRGKYHRVANYYDIESTFNGVKEFMNRQRIGLFGISQTGDFIGGNNDKLLRHKVMNTTFIDRRFLYMGERGAPDDDTSQFVNVMNEGLFTGSLGDGLVLKQTTSATAKGGLTDLYNEVKLLNKALVCPIQFPSAIRATRQVKNGGRLHHEITRKYLSPMLIKTKKRSNIAWDTYPEDYPFTLESKMKLKE